MSGWAEEVVKLVLQAAGGEAMDGYGAKSFARRHSRGERVLYCDTCAAERFGDWSRKEGNLLVTTNRFYFFGEIPLMSSIRLDIPIRELDVSVTPPASMLSVAVAVVRWQGYSYRVYPRPLLRDDAFYPVISTISRTPKNRR